MVDAVRLPSGFGFPVTETPIPKERSSKVAGVVCVISVDSEKNTILDPPSWSLRLMLASSLETISPFMKPRPLGPLSSPPREPPSFAPSS